MTSCSAISINQSPDQRSKSCDTVCSSNSGCFLRKKKPIHPLAANVRTTFSQTTTRSSNVRQRVLSAKLLKLRSLQSQLNDANHHMNEIQRENLVLKTLNQRQEKALAKYEGTNADLPRLLRTHNEEMRILTEQNKSLRKAVKDLTDLIKSRDDELLQVKKQLEHLEKLNKSKHLGEREKLTDQIEDLKRKLESADNQISTLNRKLLLEGKSSKQRLLMENLKNKGCQKNLMQALAEIERLTGLVDVNKVNANKKDDKLSLRKKLIDKDSKSQFALDESTDNSSNGRCSNESITNELPKDIAEKFKISRINCKSEETYLLDTNGDIISPTETIKNRLSSEKKRFCDFESNVKTETLNNNNTRPSSSQKLESLSNNIDSIIQKSKENGLSHLDKTLGDYCSQVMSSVKNCSKVVEGHQESLEKSKNDTEILTDAVDEIKMLDDQLKRNSLFAMDAIELKELFKNDKKGTASIFSKYDDLNGKKNKKLNGEPKAKLLATLRAIDKGELVDSFENDIIVDKSVIPETCMD